MEEPAKVTFEMVRTNTGEWIFGIDLALYEIVGQTGERIILKLK